jgi:hypothetical protein
MRFTILAVGVCAMLASLATAEGAGRRRRGPRGKEPKVGEMAPDFELILLADDAKKADAKKDTRAPESKEAQPSAKTKKSDTPAKPEKVKLSSFRTKRPVVLVFSSYT